MAQHRWIGLRPPAHQERPNRCCAACFEMPRTTPISAQLRPCARAALTASRSSVLTRRIFSLAAPAGWVVLQLLPGVLTNFLTH